MKKILLIAAAVLCCACACGCDAESSLPNAESSRPSIFDEIEDVGTMEGTGGNVQGTEPGTAESAAAGETQFVLPQTSGITKNDKDRVIRFCEFFCRKWADHYNGLDPEGFGEYVQYAALDSYLQLVAQHITVQSLASDDSARLVNISFSAYDDYAILKGTYIWDHGACGEYIFIVSNVEGVLRMNDMMQNAIDSPDRMVRPRALGRPEPDYWASPENLAAAEEYLKTLPMRPFR